MSEECLEPYWAPFGVPGMHFWFLGLTFGSLELPFEFLGLTFGPLGLTFGLLGITLRGFGGILEPLDHVLRCLEGLRYHFFSHIADIAKTLKNK